MHLLQLVLELEISLPYYFCSIKLHTFPEDSVIYCIVRHDIVLYRLFFKYESIIKAKYCCLLPFTMEPDTGDDSWKMLPVISDCLLILVYFPLTGEVRMEDQEHFSMENQSMLAVPKGED